MRGSIQGVAVTAPTAGVESWTLPRFRRRAIVGALGALVFVGLCIAHYAMSLGAMAYVGAVPIGMRGFAAGVATTFGILMLVKFSARRQPHMLVLGVALVTSGLLMATRVVVSTIGLHAGPGTEFADYTFDVSLRMGFVQQVLLPVHLLLGMLLVTRTVDNATRVPRRQDLVGLALGSPGRIAFVASAVLTASIGFFGAWFDGFPGTVDFSEVVARPHIAWAVSAHLLALAMMWRPNALVETPEGRWLRFAVFVSLLNQLLVQPFWLPGAAAAASTLGAAMNLVVYSIVGVGVLVGVHATARNEIAAREAAEEQALERSRVEAALARQAARLQQANEELAQYAYLASHDLQEPLRMVTNYLQLIDRRYRDVLDEDGREFMHFAVDGAVRMKRLTNDLLAYSRISTRPLEPRMTDAGEALAAARKNLEMAIGESGAEVTSGELPTVPVDAVQLVQLFQNLVANALKFRRPEAAPSVHVSARDEGAAWRFSVRDNGIGIDEKYHDKVFAVFQRLHRNDRYPGSGIGLALCRKIVERHGGRIWFESVPGEGTTFHFTIPIEVDAAPATTDDDDAELQERVTSLIERARELV